MKRSFIFICILFLSYSVANAKDTVLIGVLEQPQSCGEKKTLSARVLFYKDGDKWRSLGVSAGSLPSTNWKIKSIKWTVAYDSKNIGNIYIEEPIENKKYINDWYYHRDKLLKITSPSPPEIRNNSNSFSGWCSTPDIRPLVIVSKPNFNDPEKWKPINPSSKIKETLYPFLKVSVGRTNSIRCEYEPNYHSVPYDFKPQEIVLYKSYHSSINKDLVSIGLDLKKINCDGPPSPEWLSTWFLINGNDIDFIGREMELIDVGDYDGDGKPEFLFWYSGYDNDGYIIMYNDFREKTEYLWGYH